MKSATIAELLKQYLIKYPDIRFGQALFNLNINQFADPDNPEACNHYLRDIHSDSDDAILKRVLKSFSENENDNSTT